MYVAELQGETDKQMCLLFVGCLMYEDLGLGEDGEV